MDMLVTKRNTTQVEKQSFFHFLFYGAVASADAVSRNHGVLRVFHFGTVAGKAEFEA